MIYLEEIWPVLAAAFICCLVAAFSAGALLVSQIPNDNTRTIYKTKLVYVQQRPHAKNVRRAGVHHQTEGGSHEANLRSHVRSRGNRPGVHDGTYHSQWQQQPRAVTVRVHEQVLQLSQHAEQPHV